MDVNEALQLADICRTATIHRTPIFKGPITALMVLANEVRRLRAVEAVPVIWPEKLTFDDRALSEKEFKYMHECRFEPTQPALDVCNMEYMGNSVGYIYQKMEAYRNQLGQMKALDDDTRKTVLKLCDRVEEYQYCESKAVRAIVIGLREKLGAGDE